MMIKFDDFTNRVVEVYFKDSHSETGKLLGLDQNFIFLENRIVYLEDNQEHVSLGDDWIPLDTIKQISILEEDSDMVVKFYTKELTNDE